ncbi:hypothetical protein KUV23_06050 [Algoriphagus marincola]|uniref:Beta sliding clamp n=1 Tax=Algoriphagus marincola TaxID=264027 RepID=A0ABS7N3F9_9BACT|nr:DNA polymerase III subunit beta [Algoriphagus marincola]MBY5950526.1 hypothetical protein [Algoriphagus marincola]
MKVKQLKALLTLMSLVFDKKAPLPILENLLLVPGKIGVSNLDSFLWVEFDHDISDGYLPFERFKKLIGSSDPNDVIGFDSNLEKSHIYVKINGKIEAKYFFEPVEDFPVFPGKTDSLPFGKIERGVIQALQEAIPFTSRDEFRPVLNHVCIEEYVVSTDGATLHFKKLDKPFQLLDINAKKLIPHSSSGSCSIAEKEDAIAILLSKQTVQFLHRSNLEFESSIEIPRGEEAGLSIIGNRPFVEFRSNGISFHQKLPDEVFPEWRRVIPELENREHYRWTVPKSLFEKGIKQASVQANQSNYAVSFKAEKDGVVIRSEDAEYRTAFHKKIACCPLKITPELGTDPTEDLPNMREPIPESGFEIGFNAQLLIKVLKQVQSNEIRFECAASNQAAILNGEYLVMPLLLQNVS